MNNFFLLKIQWELMGLTAPAFSWIASGGIIIYFILVYMRQWRESKIRQDALLSVEARLSPLITKAKSPGEGISQRTLNEIDAAFQSTDLLRSSWQVLSSYIISRKRTNGECRYWAGEDIDSVLNSVMPIENQTYRNAPAIITGVGLLATFLAILVALLDMHLVNNRIQGLDLLIQGLSGKFLSSVVAVACATLLLGAEKHLFSPVRKAAASFCIVMRRLLPRLTSVQLLLDMRSGMAEETALLKNMTSGLSFDLNQGLAQAIGPAVEKMTAQFSDSLADVTKGRMDQVAESLATTALLLQTMNTQFGSAGDTLNQFADLARKTISDETANHEQHIEYVNTTVGNVMDRLQEHTGASLGSMERAMAAITCDMSNKLTELSSQMTSVIQKVSEQSAISTREVLDHAGALTNRSAEQLALLLKSHSEEMAKVDDLKTCLDTTLKQFASSVKGYEQMTANLEKLTADVNTAVTSLARVTKSVMDGQETAVQLLSSSASQVESLKGFSQSQQEVLDHIGTSMAQYESVFQKVENHAKDLLAQIARHLGGYSTITEKHFNMLTTTADNFISQASGRLSGSIDELGEQLDELHSAVSKIAITSHQMRQS
ncbi:MAG TPA: hypothetical protein VHO84_05140 [Syntrophorhabdaceae bacterium]|nr:hypothetical protein [Syntrophorhabdaceae bacterium]